jgi:hypothetical protein
MENTEGKKSTQTVGIIVAMVGGVCFGFFSPLFNIAVNDPFKWSASSSDIEDGVDPGGLSVATANSCFAVAYTVSSTIWNVYLMAHPPTHGTPMPRSSLYAYLSKESLQERKLAFVAGWVCALANLLQFAGGSLAGFAAGDMIQAFPLVATVWDVIVFGEFRSASRNVMCALLFMYGAYVSGGVCLALSIAM